MRLTRNFYLSEFGCNDGSPVPENLIPKVQLLAENLQVIRDEINEPLHILSGYRTKSWNKKVGGAVHSMHLKGLAGDLTAKNFTPKQLHSIILKLIKNGSISDGGVGLYKSWVHYDIRGTAARW